MVELQRSCRFLSLYSAFLNRCVANLLAKESNKNSIVLTTLSGNLKSEILGDRIVSTEIGIGKTEWDEIPLSKNLNTHNLNIKITDKNNKIEWNVNNQIR